MKGALFLGQQSCTSGQEKGGWMPDRSSDEALV